MIIGKLTKIRAIERKDLPIILKWRNSPKVYETLIEHPLLSMSHQEKWYEELLHSNDRLAFMITTSSDESMGVITLFNIDWRNRSAEWGFYIGEQKGRFGGIAAEAAYLIFKYAFEHLNLHKLYARTYSFNSKVLSFHERLGCRREGVLREHIYHNGKYEDMTLTSILKEEFLKVKLQLEKLFLKVGGNL